MYLGYKLDARGIHPAADKVKVVQEAPEPKDISQLKSYVGLLTYYARFLPNLATTLAPLYKLLRSGVKWTWTMTEQRAFQNSKKLLLSSQVSVHYDPSLEVILACDASSYGLEQFCHIEWQMVRSGQLLSRPVHCPQWSNGIPK